MNGEYSTYYNGKWTNVYELDKCIRAIQCRNADNENRIKYLEEENRKLKKEYSKDEEIHKMQERLDEMQKDYWRGFPITLEEDKAIMQWREKHNKEVHSLTNDKLTMKAEGCCGGRYVYYFIPTSLGISGVIRCHCGAEFEFQKIE